ncbi:MAG: M23 family metallopeptidase [Bacteroidota bacterium]
MKTTIIFIMCCSFFLSCVHNSNEAENDSTAASYALPYPVGKAYLCLQGFNSPYSHYGTFSYSVDFQMSTGTIVTAARAGRVVYIVENNSDNDPTPGHENVVIVMHEDSTYARYAHLTTNGALVERNQLVAPGDTVGLSGNSGSGYIPHLHFDVTKTFTGRSDQTIPFDFKNTKPHLPGLERGVIYEALGREITTLVNEYQQPGKYSVQFNVETHRMRLFFKDRYVSTKNIWTIHPVLLSKQEDSLSTHNHLHRQILLCRA